MYVHVTWGSVSEELTNIQQSPGGESESMESKGKRGESCGKLNWALNTRGDHSHLHKTSHTHTNRHNWVAALAPAYPEKRLLCNADIPVVFPDS